nr:MAG TPA: hypothetical protein [Caudoviricetes sp.]
MGPRRVMKINCKGYRLKIKYERSTFKGLFFRQRSRVKEAFWCRKRIQVYKILEAGSALL